MSNLLIENKHLDSLQSKVGILIHCYGEEMLSKNINSTDKKNFETWFFKRDLPDITLHDVYSFNDKDYITLEIQSRFSQIENANYKYCFCCGKELPCQEHKEEREKIQLLHFLKYPK